MIINIVLIALIVAEWVVFGLPFAANVALAIGVIKWFVTGDPMLMVVSIIMLMILMGMIVFENLD